MNHANVNLFIVRTSLQLFNCMEARKRFHADEQNLLLIYFKKSIDADIMRQMLDDKWTHITWYHFSGIRQQLYPWLLPKSIRSLAGKIKALYLGLISHIPRHLANVLQPSWVCLVDDGNETIMLSKRIEYYRKNEIENPRLKDKLLGKHTGTECFKNMCYFSAYDLPEIVEEEKILNDYRHFKSHLCALPQKQAFVFIGSNLVGSYIKSQMLLLDALTEVAQINIGKQLFYAPHRYEDRETLKRISELGYELLSFNTIIELGFANAGWLPSKIATLRSTALDLLMSIYGLDGEVYRLPDEQFNPEKLAEMHALYQDYERRGVHIIDIKNPVDGPA
jgi:hypothetical protein